MGVSKFPKLGLLWLWGLITFMCRLWLSWELKQNFSLYQDLSNDMSHATYMQGNQVDSWLLVVGSQIVNLTPSQSFDHNLCFRSPNGSCKPILDIYVSITFQWYIKNLSIHWVLTPIISFWTFKGAPRLQFPRWKFPWECEGLFPRTFFHSWVFFLGLQSCKPFGRKPKVRVCNNMHVVLPCTKMFQLCTNQLVVWFV